MLQQAVDRQSITRDTPLQLSVVIPTLNEAGNVEPLLERLGVALAGIEWEAIFVDDGSTDGTPDLLTEIAQRDRRVRMVRRIGRRGLSSAVVEGALASTTPIVAVIDADLQHDEKILPDLYRAIADGEHELAIGTRYAGNGSTGEWAADRLKISRLATALASPIMKTRLSDPMSGFFAVRRDVLLEAAPSLSAVGYKILLDLVASAHRPLKVAEVGYTFGTRVAGESKLDEMVALEYVELLLDKIIGRFVPVKLLMFGAIGMLGVVVHLSILYSTLIGGLTFAYAQASAVVGAMTFNFALNNRFTYRDRQLKGAAWFKGLISFYLVCALGAVANVGIGSLVYEQYHAGWWIAGIAGAIVGSVWNYVASGWLTWTKR